MAVLSPDWRGVTHGPGLEAGTLYTTVAGLLNVLVILDAAFPVELRLLFNVRDEEGARDPQELFEAARANPKCTVVRARFPSMGAGLKALKSLSFARSGTDEKAFPQDIQCGLYKTPAGATVILGAELEDGQRTELSEMLRNRARDAILVPPGGEEVVLKRPWWKVC
jgi:hypothetical protein